MKRPWVLLAVLGLVGLLYAGSRTNRGQVVVEQITNYLGDLLSPHGIRNNNPGNLKRNTIAWQGALSREQLAAQGVAYDPTFVQFDTPANGVRAMGHVLRAKAVRGLTDVEAIIRDYSATDQEAYVANVAAALGVRPQETIDVSARLPALALAIIQQENGEQPYDPNDVAEWVYA